jgi:hypothetical protein
VSNLVRKSTWNSLNLVSEQGTIIKLSPWLKQSKFKVILSCFIQKCIGSFAKKFRSNEIAYSILSILIYL